ncbi:hypothetical protein C2G38_2119734 [Gigaspora rosea]|uniref:Uncharacterized protein n=1 Tax=Gigaspora rosea TaxID=44941 RepID=A0A397U700_9GLOM|nr:hypothetical protein C2G38_2119734 [Gigaspora rosea]
MTVLLWGFFLQMLLEHIILYLIYEVIFPVGPTIWQNCFWQTLLTFRATILIFVLSYGNYERVHVVRTHKEAIGRVQVVFPRSYAVHSEIHVHITTTYVQYVLYLFFILKT